MLTVQVRLGYTSGNAVGGSSGMEPTAYRRFPDARIRTGAMTLSLSERYSSAASGGWLAIVWSYELFCATDNRRPLVGCGRNRCRPRASSRINNATWGSTYEE